MNLLLGDLDFVHTEDVWIASFQVILETSFAKDCSQSIDVSTSDPKITILLQNMIHCLIRFSLSVFLHCLFYGTFDVDVCLIFEIVTVF